MCEAKPGTRCASDTRDGAVTTLHRYTEAHPDGPEVSPLTGALLTPAPVQVPDARGRLVTVTPGVVDDSADYVYSNGQCLAFALAMHEKGADIEVALASGGWWYDGPPTELTADNVVHFVHALASWDGGDLYDIKGEHEREGYLEMMWDSHGSTVLVRATPEQLRLLLDHPSVVPQDVDTARTMADALWDFDDPGESGDAEGVIDRPPHHPDFQPAEPCPPGYVDLYHRTTGEAAERITSSGRMHSRENSDESYFSTRVDGQTDGYGATVVWVRVPEELAALDDEFPDGEQHYRVPNAQIGKYLLTRCSRCGRWAGTGHTC